MGWKLLAFEELTNLELYHILKARTDVFVVEQNCPYFEVDGKDPYCLHLFHELDGEIAAYLRIVPAGVSYPEPSLGRVLVNKEYRGKGMAKELLTQALAFIREEWQVTAVKIQAQAYLREFYGSFGFRPVSEVYMEDNIPHLDMLLQVER
ncbi:GNAT family N-acetyltransferase [Paenibacillus humicola]|uniref:GNAT family N-acetyltransferase n=1 Tax=Paenibacillus humicola TaxID=3110540 RepID=UPI00237AD0D1|nr:GNAT family N-acetyltransferase [Paenibacillus humicola]